MSANGEIIIIKRVEETAEAKKGGVWKIAHADFMTAMMAFFLIMWLVNATDEEIKKSIANYFNPMNLSQAPTDRKGLREPDDETLPPASGDEAGQRSGTRPMGADSPGDGGGAGGGGNVDEGNENRMDSAGVREETEGAVFHDPYAVLASAAADIDPENPTQVDVPQSTLGVTGETTNSDETRDPFDPAYWQTSQARPSQSLRPGRLTADQPPPNQSIDAADARPTGASRQQEQAVASLEVGSENAPDGVREQLEASLGQSLSGPSEAASTGQGSASIGPRSGLAEQILAAAAREEASKAQAEAEAAAPEAIAKSAAEELRQALEGVSAEVALSAGEESVMISLTDDDAFSMFPIGSAVPNAETTSLFARIAGVLAQRDGLVVVRGHTDARPFRSDVSDNWMLSFQRAHATKAALVANGVDPLRIARVEGIADREPSVTEDPLADANRRIEIFYEPLVEAP